MGTPTTLTAALAGLCLLLAACGSDDAGAAPQTSSSSDQPTTTAAPNNTDAPSTTAAPTTTEPPTTTEAPASTEAPTTTQTPTTTAGGDEGQDVPTINGWALEVESQPCEASDLPGSPGGEAVVPATWAAGNADYVEFVVDGDLRPANLVRDVAGPGNIQVPCDPALNDGHEIAIVAYTGTPGDPGPSTTGRTLIVVTTATVDTDEGAAGS